MNKVCKYCGKGGLSWNFNVLYKKWELLNSSGIKHKCILSPKKNAVASIPLKRMEKDPKIEKALRIFKNQLEKNPSRRDYFLKDTRFFGR
jgi:hypothetical protein